MPLTCTKKYTGFPFAHRLATHEGPCQFIHGHSWDFEFEFRSPELDKNGFILDFGELDWLKTFLTEHFDHTLVLAQSDPIFVEDGSNQWTFLDRISKLVTFPDVSCEGLAKSLNDAVSSLLFKNEQGRVTLMSVTVWESPTNSVTLSN